MSVILGKELEITILARAGIPQKVELMPSANIYIVMHQFIRNNPVFSKANNLVPAECAL